MSRKKESTTLYVDPEALAELKAISVRTKVPMAVYWRRGLDLVLRELRKAEAEGRPEDVVA